MTHLGVGPDDVQQGGLQHRVDPLSQQQVLGVTQLPQTQKHSPGQNQEGGPPAGTGPRLPLHQQNQFVQLRHTNTKN